jgi:hypothetical protein
MSNYKKLYFSFIVIIFALFIGLGMKKVNGRFVPTVSDFSSEGGGPRYSMQESLNVELANILGSTRNGDQLDVGRIYVDTISSAPDIDTITGCEVATIAAATITTATVGDADVDTLTYAVNGNLHPEHGILKSSVVTIGHVGETTTDFAFVTAANTTEQTLATDTIPAYARILDVVLITTEAVVGITTTFTIDVGDGAGTDEYADATDMKGLNAVIASPISESMLVMPISSATTIYCNATPNAQNWSAMSAGEFTLITTYLDYGSLRTKYHE